MFRFSKWLAVPVLGVALSLGHASTADAGNGFSIQIGGPPPGFGGYSAYSGYGGGYGYGYGGFQPSHRGFVGGYGSAYGPFGPPAPFGTYQSFRGGYYPPQIDLYRPNLSPYGRPLPCAPGHHDFYRGGYHHR